MKINFILGSLGICGGVKVIFEYANRLTERGHEVRIIYAKRTSLSFRGRYNIGLIEALIKRAITPKKSFNRIDWFDLDTMVSVLEVPTPAERYIPEADITVVTWWELAWWMSKYSSKIGKKFYLVQHYEIWGGPKEKVDQAYRLGQDNIVISNWLKCMLENIGAKVDSVIPNGLNFEEFYPEKVSNSGNIRVLLPYRNIKWKGIEDGIKAFQIVKEQYPSLQLVMFGPSPDTNKLPEDVEFHLNPVKERLRRIYNSCDIFVFPSHCEGFGLPPMEAMACQCSVVTTNVGAVPEYTIPGQTALVCEPRDVDTMTKYIRELVENPVKRKQIALNGYNYIQQFTWDKSVDKLEEVFCKYIRAS